MNHRQKLKMARKMMTPKEISAHIPPFDSESWNKRKKTKRDKVLKSQIKRRLG
jgi:hypothetical protein